MTDKIEITPELLADLKAKAENANPGPWIFDLPYSILTLKEAWPICDTESCNDAIFIAAANPAMMLEMIAEMRRLEKEADWLAEQFALRLMDCPYEICKSNCKKTASACWREAARKAVENQCEK